MITGQLIAMSIMFAITCGVTTLLCLPITLISQKSKTVNFYWRGFWAFLAVIAGTAGGASSLMILGLEDPAISNRVYSVLIAAFVGFVVLAWCHLSGTFLMGFYKKARTLLGAAIN